jgi:hypothetical protein
MYPKALRCGIGFGLPERRQEQLRKVETGRLIEQLVPEPGPQPGFGDGVSYPSQRFSDKLAIHHYWT